MKKFDWYLWGEWKGIMWFHSCYIFGLGLELKERSGVELRNLAVEQSHGIQRLYLLEHEWKQGGQQYLRRILNQPKILERDLRTIENDADRLLAFNKTIATVDPTTLSFPRLLSVFASFHRLNHELWSSGMVPNLLELNQSLLSSYLRNYATNNMRQSLSEADWQTLITPIDFSAAQHEERNFLRTAASLRTAAINKLRSSGNLTTIKKEFASSNILQKLKNHHRRFAWVEYGWTGPAVSLPEYYQRLIKLIQQGNARERLRQLEQQDQRLRRDQKKLERQLTLDTKHKTLLKLLRQILRDKPYRMDALYQGYAVMSGVLKELGHRANLTLEVIRASYPTELIAMLRTRRINRQRLRELGRYSIYIKEKNNLRLYTGPRAKQKMRPIIRSLSKINKIEKLTGQVAHVGRVMGLVKLVLSPKDNHKIQTGDVLVSHATDPSLIPAMSKAVAFVTDMGGLTSHAAIIAREMKKPCIVGTKIATKILKDGDRVEVDATKGIVKKL